MRLILTLMMMAPSLAFAAGSGSSSTPAPTPTSTTCTGVQVWDESTKKCVDPEESLLDTNTLYGAVRELAYAGRYEDAQGVLRAMPDQTDDRVLTYWGFTHRKLGHLQLANAFYRDALRRNPDNILARSYMGQGFIEQGRTSEAIAQWREIRARGGQGSWAEVSLRNAIRTGVTYRH